MISTIKEVNDWALGVMYQFLGIVDDVLKDIPIEIEAKIFELGCGTGAVLKRIRQIYGSDVIIGGSDLSYNAIEVARKTFQEENNHFFVISMTDKNNFVSDNSQDIVISFGAFAMYLYKDDMELALIEALRYYLMNIFDIDLMIFQIGKCQISSKSQGKSSRKNL